MSEKANGVPPTVTTTERPPTSPAGIKTLVGAPIAPQVSSEAMTSQTLRKAEAASKRLQAQLTPSRQPQPQAEPIQAEKKAVQGLPSARIPVGLQYREAQELTGATSTGEASLANLRRALDTAQKVRVELAELEKLQRKTRFDAKLGEANTDNSGRIEWSIDEKTSLFLYATRFVNQSERPEAIRLGNELLGQMALGFNIRAEGETYNPSTQQPEHIRDSSDLKTRVVASLTQSIMDANDTIDVGSGAYITKTSHEGYRLTAYKLVDEVGPKSFEAVGIVWVPEATAQKLEEEYERQASERREPFVKEGPATSFTPLETRQATPAPEAKAEVREAEPGGPFMLAHKDGGPITISVPSGDRPGIGERQPTVSVTPLVTDRLPLGTVVGVPIFGEEEGPPALYVVTEGSKGAQSEFGKNRVYLRPLGKYNESEEVGIPKPEDQFGGPIDMQRVTMAELAAKGINVWDLTRLPNVKPDTDVRRVVLEVPENLRPR